MTGTPVETNRAAVIGTWTKNREIPSTNPTPASSWTIVSVTSQTRRLERCHRTITA
jgi:hypothetical protein